MIDFSRQEFAVLLATRCSEYAQSAHQLAQMAEASHVQDALDMLARRRILQGFEGYISDGTLGIVYGYAENDEAQQVYSTIHRLPDV